MFWGGVVIEKEVTNERADAPPPLTISERCRGRMWSKNNSGITQTLWRGVLAQLPGRSLRASEYLQAVPGQFLMNLSPKLLPAVAISVPRPRL